MGISGYRRYVGPAAPLAGSQTRTRHPKAAAGRDGTSSAAAEPARPGSSARRPAAAGSGLQQILGSCGRRASDQTRAFSPSRYVCPGPGPGEYFAIRARPRHPARSPPHEPAARRGGVLAGRRSCAVTPAGRPVHVTPRKRTKAPAGPAFVSRCQLRRGRGRGHGERTSSTAVVF